MKRGASSPLWYAAVGALSGARTMAAPVLVCERFAEGPPVADVAPAKWLRSPRVAMLVHVGAAIEMVADKLPFVGARTTAVALVPRMAAGGLAGAALSSARGRSWLVGALLGATGALASAYAGYHARRFANERLHVPNLVTGLSEDLLLLGLRRTLITRV